MLDNSSFGNTEHNDCIFDIAFLTQEEIRSQSPHHTIFFNVCAGICIVKRILPRIGILRPHESK